MAFDSISADYVRIALDKVGGFEFESFFQEFYAGLIGASFVPLGGVRDGGADGYESGIYVDASRPEVYYQASTERDATAKIRKTVLRLRQFGRNPGRLIYVTSRNVKYSDRVERDLTESLNVTVQVRDGSYIAAHINDGIDTRTAFEQHLRHHTDFLKQGSWAASLASSVAGKMGSGQSGEPVGL
jgi:hypothetical protein